MQQVTSGGRKEEAVGEGWSPGRGVTAWSPGRGRSPSQCGTVSLHLIEP